MTALPIPHPSIRPFDLDPSRSRTRMRWIGRVLSGLPALFLGFDAAMKIISHPEVVAGSARLGLPAATAPQIGTILLACVALYLVPRTAPLGAVLLTGYLGGAVLTHMRVEDPPWMQVFPVVIGAILWAGLYLRDARVRGLLAKP